MLRDDLWHPFPLFHHSHSATSNQQGRRVTFPALHASFEWRHDSHHKFHDNILFGADRGDNPFYLLVFGEGVASNCRRCEPQVV